MGNDQACRVCCSLSPPSSEGAGLVSSSDFLCTSSALPLLVVLVVLVVLLNRSPIRGHQMHVLPIFFDLTGILTIPSICLPQTCRSCSAIPICQNVEMVLQTTPVPSNGLDCHAILHGK